MCVNVSKASRIIKVLRPCQCKNRDIDKTLPGHWWYEKQFLWPFGLKLNVKGKQRFSTICVLAASEFSIFLWLYQVLQQTYVSRFDLPWIIQIQMISKLITDQIIVDVMVYFAVSDHVLLEYFLHSMGYVCTFLLYYDAISPELTKFVHKKLIR